MFNQFKNRSLKIASALLIVALSSMTVPAATTDTPVPPPGVTAKSHGAASAPAAHVANSHLHGATAATPKTKTNKTTGTVAGKAKTTTARARATHWAFSEWAELHRGLGTIRGEVHGANGGTMAGVRVSLRSSKGKVLKASRRHVTHTNSGGTFVMKHVRIGSYRVRGTKGKATGHVGVKVHGGETASASLKV